MATTQRYSEYMPNMHFGSPLSTNFFRVPKVFPVGRYIAVAPLFIIVILWTSYFKHILSDLLVKQAAKSRHEADGLNCISTSFIRQLENIICMYCSSVTNNFWEIWCFSIKSFSFCFNKGYFAIIGMSQRTALPCFFSVITGLSKT